MVRRLAAEDAAAVMELCGQLGYPGTIEELRGRLETMARSEGRVGFAAMLEAELVGWIDAAVERHLQAEDTVVIGGLVSATLLTLIVLPALYAWFGRDQVTAVASVESMPRAAE